MKFFPVIKHWRNKIQQQNVWIAPKLWQYIFYAELGHVTVCGLFMRHFIGTTTWDYCTLGWSDWAFFFDCWKPTHFCWSGIFLGTQFQKIGNFGPTCVARRAKFSFSKNHRDLKNQYFCLKTCRHLPVPSTSKNNMQKENLQKNSVLCQLCNVYLL